MIPNKPRLIVTEERRPAGLAATTWQQRYPNESAPDVEIEADRPPMNFHSHRSFELLRDEYPDKYAGLKADAIREYGDCK